MSELGFTPRSVWYQHWYSARTPCWPSPVAEDMKSWRRDRSPGPCHWDFKKAFFSRSMDQMPSSGPSASASSQGCFEPWSTFMAWSSSTATSRGERNGWEPAKGSDCRDGMAHFPGSPSSSSVSLLFAFLSPPHLPRVSLSLLYLQKSVLQGCVSAWTAYLSPHLSFWADVFPTSTPYPWCMLLATQPAGLHLVFEVWGASAKPPGILSLVLTVFPETVKAVLCTC